MSAPDPWNGYRPPLRRWDLPLLWFALACSIAIVVGVPAFVMWHVL